MYNTQRDLLYAHSAISYHNPCLSLYNTTGFTFASCPLSGWVAVATPRPSISLRGGGGGVSTPPDVVTFYAYRSLRDLVSSAAAPRQQGDEYLSFLSRRNSKPRHADNQLPTNTRVYSGGWRRSRTPGDPPASDVRCVGIYAAIMLRRIRCPAVRQRHWDVKQQREASPRTMTAAKRGQYKHVTGRETPGQNRPLGIRQRISHPLRINKVYRI